MTLPTQHSNVHLGILKSLNTGFNTGHLQTHNLYAYTFIRALVHDLGKLSDNNIHTDCFCVDGSMSSTCASKQDVMPTSRAYSRHQVFIEIVHSLTTATA